MDLVALKAAMLVAHPVTGAFNVDDALAAAEMNALNVVRIKASMTGSEIWKASDNEQLELLRVADPARYAAWIAFCAIADHDPAVGGLDQLFTTDIFDGVTGNTVSNLNTQRNETVSQATVDGLGLVKKGHVKLARALP